MKKERATTSDEQRPVNICQILAERRHRGGLATDQMVSRWGLSILSPSMENSFVLQGRKGL